MWMAGGVRVTRVLELRCDNVVVTIVDGGYGGDAADGGGDAADADNAMQPNSLFVLGLAVFCAV